MNATAPNSERSNAVLIWVLLAAGAALVLAYSYFAGGGPSGSRGETGSPVGRKLSYLHLEPLTGDSRPVKLDDLKGHVTVLNYWGTWCGPCNIEFPHLLEVAAQFSDNEDFRIYPVSCGTENADADLEPLRAETESFLKAKGTTIATYADQNGASRSAMIVELDLANGGFGYPTTLIFDRAGRIRGFWLGYQSPDTAEMRSLIKILLADKSSAGAG